MSEGALPYHEPDITTILTQASFLLLLNIVAVILDGVVYCGLVGQVLSGMAWGTPGAKLLPQSCEEVVTQLGYLGLIALVFEGGLSTSIKSIKNNLALAILVAVTGISGPIALSFALLRLASATNVQAFAAGAALCSTSLGTTFSLLKSTGLTQSRLGIVLITAAMLDDVVGLILVQIITNLGSGQTSIEASTILRPIFVSIGLVLGLVVSCRYIFRPMVSHARATKVLCHLGPLNPMLLGGSLHFIISTLFLLALVTAASYAGTSVLFAAYLAGASVSWLDGRIGPETGSTRAVQPPREHVEIEDSCKVSERATDIQLPTLNDENANGLPTDESDEAVLRCDRQMKQPIPPPDTLLSNNKPVNNCSSYHMSESVTLQSRSMLMYEKFYAPAVERILKPFFFVSYE